MDKYLPEGFTYIDDDTTEPPTNTEEQEIKQDLPEGFTYITEEDDIVEKPKKKVTPPIKEISIDESKETLSLKDLEEDQELYDDILQYRLDRFNIEKDKGAYNFLTGFFSGDTQELNNKNLVDDYLDHYRGIKNNIVTATAETNWLKSLKAKEDEILKKGVDNLSSREIDLINNYREQRARATRIYQKADRLGGLFNEKRYEDMEFAEKAGDIAKTVGVNIFQSVSDPITVVTSGIGRVIGGIASAAGFTPFKSAIVAAGSAAPLEAGASAYLDIAVQKTEIEMGIKKEIDFKQTATVATISAATAGTLSAIGTKNSASRVDKASRGKITEALKRATEKQVKMAEETNKKLGVESDKIREKLAKGISDIYGTKSIIRDKNGKIKGIDSKLIRESDKATALKNRLEGLEGTDVEASFNFGTFERVVAGTGELIEAARQGKIKFKDEIIGKELKEFQTKLQKNEMVSERLLNILSNTSEESLDFTTKILGKYGITQRELAASLFADASYAGKRLQKLSALSKIVGRASRVETASEAGEIAEAQAASTIGQTFRRLEDIRRLTLVSGIATAVRNNFSQVIRSGVDTLVYGLESGLHSVAGTGRKKFGLRSTLAQLEHTFYDAKDAATVSKFLLDLSDTQKIRFYNQYSEVRNTLNIKNPGQKTTSKLKNGLNKETPILDKWESVVHAANSLNRYQEFIYRNGMFTASIQRQLYDKGEDLFKVLNSGEVTKFIDEGMITKAVDDSLDFTYASQPKVGLFKVINKFIVQSGATLAIPFPRFMFKAMEMTYNYNVTGVATAATKMLFAKSKGEKISDGAFRQMAEGIAGGTPLLALGYYLRDPDGETAGSDWYMLKDGLGNEFDARPFFPLTPYLLMGEVMHRMAEDRPGKVVDFAREVIPGFTGANFRGSGAAGKFIEDMLAMSATTGDPQSFTLGAKEMGKYFGEAISGYGQPIYQFADIFTSSDQRMRDFKDDPEYREGIFGFFKSAGAGFIAPFEGRLKRVSEAVGFEIDDPYREDPRFEDVPERVMPFMKILFGATLTRVPPKYVSDLNRMGFSYVDFMSKTNSANLDRILNREMGFAMQTEMPQVIEASREDYPDSPQAQAKEIRNYISIMKSMLYADLKLSDEGDAGLKAELSRFRKLGPYGRRAAVEAFNKSFKRSPDFNDHSDVAELMNFGKNNFKFYQKQRKQMK